MNAQPPPAANGAVPFVLPSALSVLGQYRQFIVCRFVPRDAGKTDKFPIDWRDGKVASAHDPAIWLSCEEAAAYATAWGDGHGVGFVFTTADPFWFLDIDACRVGDTWSPLAMELLGRFNGAAVEVSHSDQGLHVIGSGVAPAHRSKNVSLGIELYTDKRFVALTGTSAMGDAATRHDEALAAVVAQYFAPDVAGLVTGWTTEPCAAWRGPTDDDDLIRRALMSRSARAAFGNRASFADLWEANADALARAYPDAQRGYDASSADSALAQHLAFWTGKNCERIRALMPRSSLVREKWNRDDYLTRTILGVVARQRDVLADPIVTPPSPPAPSAALLGTVTVAGEAGGRARKQADILLDVARSAELFHACDGTGYADVDINGHRETWPIRSKGFKRWLARGFFNALQSAPNSEALQSALGVLEAKAQFDAPEHAVHIRVGELDGRLYLDLVDDAWRAVEIDAAGWRVIDKPPIRFRRAAGMKPLPTPADGGSIAALRSFLNVQSERDFVLVVAWVLAALRNHGPYPVIVLSGEQGSSKSTFSELVRALIDPNTAPLRALPREDRDFFIAANNAHVLAFDNVSVLSQLISDTICRLASGGGFATRTLYSDQDETLFDAARPMILNGIEDIVIRPDLADRALVLTLEPIPENRRRPLAELKAAFEADRPRILGVLLDAVSEGLRRLPETRLTKLPRMADFAQWATACETALWPAGTFSAAYSENRDDAVDRVLDADPIAAAVRKLVESRSTWAGTASDLLHVLAGISIGSPTMKAWPNNGRALSGRLRRAASFLRAVGINIAFEKEGRGRTRIIQITKHPD